MQCAIRRKELNRKEDKVGAKNAKKKNKVVENFTETRRELTQRFTEKRIRINTKDMK